MLGVIIVGIAIVVGINLFQASAIDQNRNAIIKDLTTLASKAQEYYKKPTSMGGGGNSFVGFAIPTGLSTNANGTFAISGSATATQIVFTGTGTETGNDGSTKVKATVTVTSSAVQPSMAINN